MGVSTEGNGCPTPPTPGHTFMGRKDYKVWKGRACWGGAGDPPGVRGELGPASRELQGQRPWCEMRASTWRSYLPHWVRADTPGGGGLVASAELKCVRRELVQGCKWWAEMAAQSTGARPRFRRPPQQMYSVRPHPRIPQKLFEEGKLR